MQRFLTVDEVAQRLRMSPSAVYGWLKEGILPAFKLGGTWRIDEKKLNHMLEEKLRQDIPQSK